MISLTRNNTESLDCDETLFFKVVKTAFNQRRKTLRNAVRSMLQPEKTAHPLLDKRAEQLSVSQFEELTRFIQAK